MTEIEAIMQRHSVRAYLDREIEPEKAEALKEQIKKCNEEGNLHMQFYTDTEKTFGKFVHNFTKLKTAPAVIVCAGKDDETLEERVGYYGEQIVLLAQRLGLNTCWVGMFQEGGTPVELDTGEKLVIVIAVGYGKTQGKQHKSKSYDQVVAGTDEKPEWFRRGVELALLAPTAVNQQKFVFHLKEDDSVEVVEGQGPFSKVDKGIVKYHFDVGAAEVRSGSK